MLYRQAASRFQALPQSMKMQIPNASLAGEEAFWDSRQRGEPFGQSCGIGKQMCDIRRPGRIIGKGWDAAMIALNFRNRRGMICLLYTSQELGVRPYAEYIEPNHQLLTQTRQDEDGNMYLYAYNYCSNDYHQKSSIESVRSEDHGTNIQTARCV